MRADLISARSFLIEARLEAMDSHAAGDDAAAAAARAAAATAAPAAAELTGALQEKKNMRESATNYTKRARARILRGLEACARRAQVGGARIHGSKCKIQVHFLSAHEKICAHRVRRGIKI